jgi:hypothetical protein
MKSLPIETLFSETIEFVKGPFLPATRIILSFCRSGVGAFHASPQPIL